MYRVSYYTSSNSSVPNERYEFEDLKSAIEKAKSAPKGLRGVVFGGDVLGMLFVKRGDDYLVDGISFPKSEDYIKLVQLLEDFRSNVMNRFIPKGIWGDVSLYIKSVESEDGDNSEPFIILSVHSKNPLKKFEITLRFYNSNLGRGMVRKLCNFNESRVFEFNNMASTLLQDIAKLNSTIGYIGVGDMDYCIEGITNIIVTTEGLYLRIN